MRISDWSSDVCSSDLAYDAARSSGQIGEKMDGYLGIVDATTPNLKRLVDDINIKRRAVYAARAQENNATLEEYAISAGCQLILKTVPGEKYQAPDGELVPVVEPDLGDLPADRKSTRLNSSH